MDPLEIYSKIQSLVLLDIDNKIQKYADQAKFNVPQIPAHGHTGVDSTRIRYEDLLGIPITSTTPTDSPRNGTLRLYENGATIRIYAYLNNVWRYANLT